MRFVEKSFWACFVLLALVAVTVPARAIVFPDSSAHGNTAPFTKQYAPAAYVAPAPPAPKTPTKVTLSGAATSSSTAVGGGACLRISCTVDCSYRVTSGSSTGVADDNQLPASTPERLCLDNLSDNITFYSTAAGSAYVSVTVP